MGLTEFQYKNLATHDPGMSPNGEGQLSEDNDAMVMLSKSAHMSVIMVFLQHPIILQGFQQYILSVLQNIIFYV